MFLLCFLFCLFVFFFFVHVRTHFRCAKNGEKSLRAHFLSLCMIALPNSVVVAHLLQFPSKPTRARLAVVNLQPKNGQTPATATAKVSPTLFVRDDVEQ